MDSPTERMPIACVHCAKAKAKCDKKIPCSRCVSKQIVCQSRATRRSSNNPSRRNGLPRANSERALHASAQFHIPQLSQFTPPTPGIHGGPTNNVSPTSMHHRVSLAESNHPIPIAPAMFGAEVNPHMLRNGYGNTTPEMVVPLTPMMPNMPHMDHFVHMPPGIYDQDCDNPFLGMGNNSTNMMDFDPTTMLTENFMSPPTPMMHDPNDPFALHGKVGIQAPGHMVTPMHIPDGSTPYPLRLDFDDRQLQTAFVSPASLSPTTSSSTSGLQEPEAVIAAQNAWPLFQCNHIEQNPPTPPKTGAIYLEGLAQTLRNQATWQAWASQLDEKFLDISTERKIATEPVAGWSREKLLAITQGFLHRALDIHKADHAREDTPSSPDSSRDAFLMLPPPDVMQYFLRSYVVRFEPYYTSVPAGRLDLNVFLQSNNSRAASLLALTMVASGAMATPTVEARYIASGLTEACRLSLFDTIEKDVFQSREVIVLRTALLFICLAAWSGDKWHMDMAVGQRGLYLSMVDHAGMFKPGNSVTDIEKCRQEPDNAWEDWKDSEGKYRLAHSWIMLDQEMSLFTDTNTLMSINDLHTPVPDSDDLWHAESSAEWLLQLENVHGSTYHSQPSVRNFFTSFMDGELADKNLSPTQLRLLLQPLQSQVFQLREILACLPDNGKRADASSAGFRAATKARLQDLSSLLQQWYAITKRSFSGSKGDCWTTAANLILYHLICLNAITSFKEIERFARMEVSPVSPETHKSWLQKNCIDHPQEVFFHCGQILRTIRTMPYAVRPPWWSGAVYRVALIGWATGMSTSGDCQSPSGPLPGQDVAFPIDNVIPDDELLSRYLNLREGTPMVTRADGSLAPIEVPFNILQSCVELLEDDSSMRLTDGIKRKLRTFMTIWGDD